MLSLQNIHTISEEKRKRKKKAPAEGKVQYWKKNPKHNS